MDFGCRLGFFAELCARGTDEFGQFARDLLADLERMIQNGWVERRDERFAPTP
jgi:hypothetical protein